jgi:hypothetical protein
MGHKTLGLIKHEARSSLTLQAPVFGPQRFLVFNMLRVDRDASHWTDLHALGLIEMANAFSALGRVDFINLFAQINSLVRALGLTHIAVDAFIGDHQCHATSST